jgi:penicillin-insensitive murein endopeptidase
MVALFVMVATLDRRAQRQASPANPPTPVLRVEKAPDPIIAEPVNIPPPEPAVETAKTSPAPPPEPGMSELTEVSPQAIPVEKAEEKPEEAKLDKPDLKDEAGRWNEATKTEPAAVPSIQPQDIVRVAATAVQIPSPAPIPAIATKLTPAKILFGAAKEPANLATRSIGFYARGCLAGAQPLPVDGPAWQAMRLSRNRMWGHPSLVKFIEKFAKDAKAKDGWPGLLVGDMSMPRGGPMPFGHASHQVGLDVDIWYKPMPERQLTAEEREKIPMETFLLDGGHVDPKVWSPDYAKLLRRAVSYPEVARIFVNPAIKKWLCDNVKEDRAFLRKITPIMGHDDHFHVRLVCPADNPGCEGQALRAADEGCGKGLDTWIAQLSKQGKPTPGPTKDPVVSMVPVTPPAPKPINAGVKPGPNDKKANDKKPKVKQPITLAQLPPECAVVLKAPSLTAAASR